MPPKVITRGIDATAGLARRYLHGSSVHRWPITNWLYRHLMRFTQGGEAAGPDLTLDFRGCTLLASASDVTITPTLRDGTYEKAELDAWLALLKPGDHVVDVGANIGTFTVLSARAVGPTGSVTAFEPEPENIRRLRANVEANALGNVTIVEACVGDATGQITLYIQSGQSGTHSAIPSRGATTLSVPVHALDDFITRRPVAAMKIDVEGLEAAVLAGAQRIVTQDRPSVLLEYNGGTDLRSMLAGFAHLYGDCTFISRREHQQVSLDQLRDLERLSGFGNVLLRSPAAPSL